MARTIWRADYSSASDNIKWIFVHEMVHVWQSTHGQNNIVNGIKIWHKFDDYDDAYNYNLDDSNSLYGHNMEQQASIIPDYWFVLRNLTPKYNRGMRAQLKDYSPFIVQLRSAGPPRLPTYRLDRNTDWDHSYRT